MKFGKRIFIFSLMLGVVVCGIAILAFAYLPPSSRLEDAIKNGEAMFVGRIVGIEEVQHTDSETIARAKVRLIHCFFGIQCQKDDELSILYYSDTLMETVFPVPFSISREVLFVLLQKPTEHEEYMFDSHLIGGVDFAFEIDVEDVLTNFKDRFLSNTDSIRLTNVYWQKDKEWISRSDVEEMVQSKIKQK